MNQKDFMEAAERVVPSRSQFTVIASVAIANASKEIGDAYAKGYSDGIREAERKRRLIEWEIGDF